MSDDGRVALAFAIAAGTLTVTLKVIDHALRWAESKTRT